MQEGSILFCAHSYDLCEDFGWEVEERASSTGVRCNSSVKGKISYGCISRLIYSSLNSHRVDTEALVLVQVRG